MPTGIPNIGNCCYASSVIQCLRRILRTDLLYKSSQLSGKQEDPHEFYCLLMDLIDAKYKNKLMVKFEDSVEAPYIIINNNMTSDQAKVIKSNDYICLYYKIPSLRDINTCDTVTIDDKQYNLVAMVVWVKNMSHYYAIVEENDIWYRCDDMRITIEKNMVQSMYMGFYQLVSN